MYVTYRIPHSLIRAEKAASVGMEYLINDHRLAGMSIIGSCVSLRGATSKQNQPEMSMCRGDQPRIPNVYVLIGFRIKAVHLPPPRRLITHCSAEYFHVVRTLLCTLAHVVSQQPTLNRKTINTNTCSQGSHLGSQISRSCVPCPRIQIKTRTCKNRNPLYCLRCPHGDGEGCYGERRFRCRKDGGCAAALLLCVERHVR